MNLSHLLVATLAIFAPGTLAAQVEPLDENGGNRPTVEPVVHAEPLKLVPHSRLHLFTDRADVFEQGWLQLEGGWQANFIDCSAAGVISDERCDLQVGVLLGSLTPTDAIEVRLGWYFLGIQGLPGENLLGVGDLFAEAKFEIPLDIDDPHMHQLAVVGHVRPGIAQDPVAVEGVDLAAYAVYSTFPSVIRLDVQAGLRLGDLFHRPSVIQMPLSGAVTWRAVEWLDVYGEFIEALTFNDLNTSETSLRVGVGFLPLSRLALNLGTRIGLSRSLPNATLEFSITGLASTFERSR